MATQALQQIELIVSGDESDGAVAQLRLHLEGSGGVPSSQLRLLSCIPRSKPHFFRLVLQWCSETEHDLGGSDSGIDSLGSDDQEDDDLERGDMGRLELRLAFTALVEIFKEEKGRLLKEEKVAKINSVNMDDRTDNPICAIVRGFLQRMPRVFKDGKVDTDNLLHAVCRHGTESLARAVINAIEERRPDVLEDLLQAHNTNGETPLKTALYIGDSKLVKLLACHDDGKRPDHVLEVVKTGKLEQLKILLSTYEGEEELLSDSVFLGAAEAGHVDIWEFLMEQRPKAANNARLLQTAIKHRQKDIVNHLVGTHLEVLRDLEDAACTAESAVGIVKQTSEKLKEARENLKETREKLKSEPATLGGKLHKREKKLMKTVQTLRVQYDVSNDIRNILLESLVRILKPRDVKSCWPSDPGKLPTATSFISINPTNKYQDMVRKSLKKARTEQIAHISPSQRRKKPASS
jgi:hypothetical protein